MKYIYLDGDDIGLKIEKCFMTNDEDGLKIINSDINSTIFKITEYLQQIECEIIFSGADGIIFKKVQIDVEQITSFIQSLKNNFTFSIGVGNSLQEAFLALRYAKSNGKNGSAILESDFEWIQG